MLFLKLQEYAVLPLSSALLREITCSTHFQDILISLLSTFETPALGHVMKTETQVGYIMGLGYCCIDPFQGSSDCGLPLGSKPLAAAPHPSSIKWTKCQMDLVTGCLACGVTGPAISQCRAAKEWGEILAGGECETGAAVLILTFSV